MSEAVPHYITTPGGQVRLWIAGSGANLVAVAGLTRAAGDTARRLAAACPGWRAIVMEAPGAGGSATAAGATLAEAAGTLADALGFLDGEPFALAGLELSCALAGLVAQRLPSPPTARFSVGADTAAAWAATGMRAEGFAPRQDGSHLQAMWSFLRDRHLLDPANPRMPARDGEPLPGPAELSECFVAASVAPQAFEHLWNACLDAAPAVGETGVRALARLADLPHALRDVRLPQGNTLPGPTRPLPDGEIWHDYVATAPGRIHLRRAGSGGEPLLVIPTGGGSSAQFAPVISGLARKRSVFAVDYPGNGLSFKPADRPTIETLARDLLALLDAMEIGSLDVWGSHTGALVGLELAVIAPERVGRLVMEGPVFISKDFEEDLLANYFPRIVPDKWGLHLPLVWNWRRDLFMYWPWYRVERPAARTLGVPSAEELQKYAVGILESGETYDGAYRSAFSYDTRARLPLLTRPALVCAGPDDMLKDGLPEAQRLGPTGLVTVRETPCTVWWPDPDPGAAAATMELYREFLGA